LKVSIKTFFSTCCVTHLYGWLCGNKRTYHSIHLQ